MILTEELVIKEMERIAKKLDDKTFTQIAYDANCQIGFSSYFIKKKLNLSFVEAKKKANLKTKTNAGAEKSASLRNKMFKIYCPALENGKGGMIKKLHCVPGYKPQCETCENLQKTNAICKED